MIFRLFIDEVGNGDLKGAATNENVRYLSLTGVFTRVDLHDKIIQPQIDDLKQRLFGHIPAHPVILHRRELIRKEGAFSVLRDAKIHAAFNDEILVLLRKLPYLVITVQIDKKQHLEQYKVWQYDPYHYCLKCMIERYVLYLNSHEWRGDVMIEARFKKVDKKLKASFAKIYRDGTEHILPEEVQKALLSHDIQMTPKMLNVAGLQIADLIAYPSARHMRCQRDRTPHPQDFGAKVVEILVDKKYRRHPESMKIKGFGTKWLPH